MVQCCGKTLITKMEESATTVITTMEESATEYSDRDSGHVMEVERPATHFARVQEPVKLIDVSARN